jgi:hypothetical protein
MVRHEDIGPKSEAMLPPSPVDGFRQPSTRTVSFKEGKTALAAERPFMGMSWQVKRLPM